MDRKERLRGFRRAWPAEQKEFSAAVGRLEAMVEEGLKDLRRLRREEDEAEMEYWERMLHADVEAAPRDSHREKPKELQRVVFYVDGSCLGNGMPGGGWMGAGIVRCVDGEEEQCLSVPLGRGTNNRAELLAAIVAMQSEADLRALDVVIWSDSAYTVGLLGGGWKATKNQDLVGQARQLTKTCGKFRIDFVKGHNGHPLNEQADVLSNQAAEGQA